MADPYIRRMQEYAESNRRKVIDQAVNGAEQSQPAQVQGGMSQSDFAGKKTPDTPSRRAKLAELLKKQAQEQP